ncbi:MAG TPA: hypothetical protein VHX68_06575 [Planctomycetaceae bacterium]|jgi:hypothetical protein|nr:hypothetical protein [Planctomycetaceae bacterium]
MTTPSMQWPLAIASWGIALFATLQLQFLPSSALGNHSVCGPWGCGPPLSVLLACHAFWMVLIAPPSLIAARRLRPQTVCALGLALVSAAILGLIAVGVWEAATWWPQASEWGRPYVVHRYLFAVFTLTDAPLLEALAVGGGVWFVGLKRLNGLPAQ